MGKTAIARVRMEPEVKEEAEKILAECGLSASEAIGTSSATGQVP